MPRFFMLGTNIKGGTALIRGRDAEHIKVLRLRPGEKLTLCDGSGTDYNCRLVRSDRDEAEAEIIEVVPCRAEPSVYTWVLCGLPKGDKTDFIIQKCVEAGASEIVFFRSERCIAKTDAVEKKLERWQRIAEEAAKQSGRGIIPQVSWLPTLTEAINCAMQTELPVLMYETGERESLSHALKGAENVKSAAVITGPEGGFEAFEADMARKCGLHICSMGERILRCETAPLVALTALMYESGNLD
ncbi:MAG: 16S rRNA (uracil(1498)-N(3))-methyltransferase [Oscillospiraceae bacterium]|nr:16S rRNA (uracil(1498)-N(3))-methyltransferase [Oscillospiraceae bacterium]